VQGTRETICANLAKMLARSDIQLHYDNPDVHEIIVVGDVAVVRLTWILTTQMNGAKDKTTEEGMDIQPETGAQFPPASSVSTRPRASPTMQALVPTG
jgi:hypothetical protein